MQRIYDVVALLAVLLLVACSGEGSAVTHSEDVDSSDSSSVSDDNGFSDKSSGKSSSSRKEESSSSALWDWTSPKEDLFNPDVEYGSMTDSRDGKTYRTVTFMFNDSSMTWMAEI